MVFQWFSDCAKGVAVKRFPGIPGLPSWRIEGYNSVDPCEGEPLCIDLGRSVFSLTGRLLSQVRESSMMP